MDVTQIDALAERLSRLRYATVGRGPGHPTHSNERLAPDLAREVGAHPFLVDTHPDFVQFLERYEGAAIIDPENQPEDRTLLVFGIGEYEEAFSDPVDPETGFYIFAVNLVHFPRQAWKEFSFGFSTADPSDRRVYACPSTPTPAGIIEGEFKVFCSSFTAWLERVIQADGRLATEGAVPG